MKSSYININNKQEADFLTQLLKRPGLDLLPIFDDDKRLIARKKLIQISNRIKKSDVSEKDIQYEIDKVRRKRYTMKNKDC
jgi:hypothetical protein